LPSASFYLHYWWASRYENESARVRNVSSFNRSWHTRPGVLVAALALMLAPSEPRASDAPANSLRELFGTLNRCLQAPKGSVGSELTIVFSLRRDGSLLGKPRITFAKLPGDVSEQRVFADSIDAAFNKCLPVAITDGLGGAIAGRLLSIRFVIRGRETNT
jgi:hypothetical protein